MPEETTKPEMTQKEASFQVAQTAAAARRKAQASGAGENAVETLMNQNETLQAAGITLRPYSLATLWALQKVSSKYLEQQSLPVDAFAPLDRDGDGLISQDDVLQNTRLPADIVGAWFKKIDADEDGKISLPEFVAARGLPRALEPQDVVIAALCFAEPREIWKRANEGGINDIMDRAFEIATVITPAELAQVNAFMNRWFAQLEDGSATAPKKKAGAPSTASSPTTTAAPPDGS